jgi:hypothetical protein
MADRPSSIPPRSDLDFLVESIPNPLHGVGPKMQKHWPALVVPLILSLAAGMLCNQAAGPTLGLFLGGIFAAALLIGPLVAAESTWLGRLLVVLAVAHGIAAVWFYVALNNHLGFGACFSCYLVLVALCLAFGAVSWMLRRFGIGISGTAAVITVIAIAWLLWPIWLSPILAGPHGDTIVKLLIPIHPIIAANAALREQLGYWAEQAIAYHYTSLSDDVNYSLPTNVFACVAFHLILAGICVGVIGLKKRFTERSSTSA